ncbi:MAG: D-2-hydroxyacid dehydrogenase [Acidobacteria bacterium]|nr:D-2-hydroxyacid dehydrogenase [Acidobacteriota bacterium]
MKNLAHSGTLLVYYLNLFLAVITVQKSPTPQTPGKDKATSSGHKSAQAADSHRRWFTLMVLAAAMKILLAIHHSFELWNAPEWLGPRLQQQFHHMRFVQLGSFDNLMDEIRDAEVLMGWQLRVDQFRAAQQLRWIHATTAAVHQLMFPELVASEVRLTSSTEIHGPVVAEHAIALVCALAKGLAQTATYQERKHWGQQDLWRSRMRPQEIAGARLLVIGLGAIGKHAIPLAKGLGMRVFAVRQHPERGTEGADRVFSSDELESVLPQSDYVLLAAPLTSKTRALFGDRLFGAMRENACFLNVSRGALVDEAALERALRSHRIRAAALDVFQTEPLPADSSLWELDNLIITPHTAAITENLWERHYVRFTENLRRYTEGKPLLGEVDKQRGY